MLRATTDDDLAITTSDESSRREDVRNLAIVAHVGELVDVTRSICYRQKI